MSRISLQSLADSLGLARSTVSRALRNDPEISQKTRDRVQRAAQETGYTANPYLSVLMAGIREGLPPSGSPVVAFINPYRSREGWREHRPMLVALRGATERANELGFELQEFWLGEPGMTVDRLRYILHSRGIRALILGAPSHPSEVFDFDTHGFAAVAINLDPARQHLHRVTPDYLGNTMAALRGMRQLGYRRVGLAIDRQTLENMHCLPRMAFLEFEQSIPRVERAGFWSDGFECNASFAAWLLDRQPDGIVTAWLGPQSWLQPLGFRIPQDIGLAQLDPDFSNQPLTGIDGRFAVVGRNAVDLLMTRIQRNDFKPPQDPMHVLTPGTWVSGTSTVDRRAHPQPNPYDETRLGLCQAAASGDPSLLGTKRAEFFERFYGGRFALADSASAKDFATLPLGDAANTPFHSPTLPPRFMAKLVWDLPEGPQVYRGIPWCLPRSAATGPATVITVNAPGGKPQSGEADRVHTVAVESCVRAVYFLHMAYYVWSPDPAGEYALVYSDGQRHKIDLLPFWSGTVDPRLAVFQDAWQALPQFESDFAKPLPLYFRHEALRLSSYFYVFELRNPRPEQTVRAIEIRTNPKSPTRLVVAGITALRA